MTANGSKQIMTRPAVTAAFLNWAKDFVPWDTVSEKTSEFLFGKNNDK